MVRRPSFTGRGDEGGRERVKLVDFVKWIQSRCVLFLRFVDVTKIWGGGGCTFLQMR